ncbi:hypothetical protein [Dyella sp. EPa41]|uniref:hypothetical protein n=1 Tax=Dyella sp. EPa41 TaxID=1561194 RepID=UPI001916C413|nr:hypothetical protein [Dyella sp. EPa41]
MITRIFVCLMAFCLLPAQACRASSAPGAPESATDAPVETICAVRGHPNAYVGKVVRLKAVYKSDEMYYSALFDETCDKQKTLDVEHPLRTHGDQSVVAFFHEVSDRCKKKQQVVCPTKVDLDVDVLIRKKQDGGSIAEFMHIRSYTFSS